MRLLTQTESEMEVSNVNIVKVLVIATRSS